MPENPLHRDSTPLVTAIIVTFNSERTIGRALDRLQPAVERNFAQCIVVDNCSRDRTRIVVRRDYPWSAMICSRDNLGFGKACNLGFRSVSTPYVLFLNPDASIEPDALRTLVRFMDAHPDVGITAPATLVGDGRYQRVGLVVNPMGVVLSALGVSASQQRGCAVHPGESPVETEWVGGGVMLIRSATFRATGGFDPRFFLYFEETDLFLRVRAIGARIVAVGDAPAYHEGYSAAVATGEPLIHGCVADHFFRSRYYYLVKNFGRTVGTLSEAIAAFLELLRYARGAFVSAEPRFRARVSPLRRPFLRMPLPVTKVHGVQTVSEDVPTVTKKARDGELSIRGGVSGQGGLPGQDEVVTGEVATVRRYNAGGIT